MLSICFVSQEYPEETGWGGIGTYTYEMAHGLARAGHKVVVLSRAVNEPSHEIESDGVEVYRIRPALNIDSVPVLWRLNRWWEGYRLAVAQKLKEIVKTHQIDLIEAPELHAETLLYPLAGRRRVPSVIRLHGGTGLVTQFEDHQHPKFGVAKKAERRVVSEAAMVTAPSKAVVQASREWLSGLDTARVIANPVNTELFAPNGNAPDHAPTQIVCVGTPRPVKGFHVLAQAITLVWKELPAARFQFVTPLPSRPEDDPFREILGDLYDHPQIEVRSRVAHADMPSVYRHATLCVVPSLWPEPFGYSCVEPMACGVPVIASRTGALSEIVEDGKSGILVEPNNPSELARAIIKLVSDRAYAVQLGANARRRAANEFSSPAITNRMADAYGEVIQAHQRRRTA